jgi:hypothetical protein
MGPQDVFVFDLDYYGHQFINGGEDLALRLLLRRHLGRHTQNDKR